MEYVEKSMYEWRKGKEQNAEREVIKNVRKKCICLDAGGGNMCKEM